MVDTVPGKVLCVDGDARLLESLQLQLRGRYEVLLAPNANDGLDLLRNDADIAAVIADLGVRTRDGATFLTRARQVAPNAGRILLTGHTDLNSAITAFNEAQVLRFLTKPCPTRELYSAIDAAIEFHRRERSEHTGLRRALKAQITSQDAVTGLASRTRFNEILHGVCGELDGLDEGRSCAVLLIHLENLHDINTVQGHAAGDQVLQVTARRLRELCPAARGIARWGDDEFALVLPTDFVDEAVVSKTAEALIAQLAVPIALAATAQRIRACIGIAGIPVHATDAATAMKFADIALRQARLKGGGVACLFRSDWAQRVEYRYQLLVALREAIEADALHLHFQPIIDLTAGSVRTLEALARWQHPTLGLVPPAKFIQLAEESGDMPRLGLWILRQACREGRALVGKYCARVAVNVSMQQLLHDEFLSHLDAALRAGSLDPRELAIELTESVFSRDADRALQRVTALRQRGISVAIDDFGTGYSSLAYLQRFAADTIKLDRSFVATLGQGGETIISAALSIGRSFGMEVVVEGVETEDERRQLTALGASLFQGYLYGRPMPRQEIPRWFAGCPFVAAPGAAAAQEPVLEGGGTYTQIMKQLV
jgi:diguanylate cyclase (GGDEF)-like protein